MYDYTIIGGGIAGLYTAYQISKKYPQSSILLLESQNRFGGRIYTYHDKTGHNLEFGAGRFNENHRLLFELLEDLNLTQHIVSIQGKSFYKDAGASAAEGGGAPVPSPVGKLCSRIISATAAALGENKVTVQKMRAKNLIEFVHDYKILDDDDIHLLQDSYGYYSELIVMNAYDSIQLMKYGTNPNLEFYGLAGNGGYWSRIIEELVLYLELQTPQVKLVKNKTVSSVKVGGAGGSAAPFTIATKNGETYTSKTCIFAIPRPDLEKFSILRQKIAKELSAVICQPLCRIYSYFDNHEPWLKDLKRTTINNDIRYIIPYKKTPKEHLVMISYTDHNYAQKWNAVYEAGGISAVNEKLKEDLVEGGIVSPEETSPRPKKTKIAYWDCGVGYWAVGANSTEVAAKMLRPFPEIDLYICGENYSKRFQQWVEGALETSMSVIHML